MENDGKWFEYSLSDAWYIPISSVTVLKGEKNTAVFAIPEDGVQFEPIQNSLHSRELSGEVMNEIQHILSDDRLYAIDELEFVPVFDGYKNRFYFSDGKRQIELYGSNIFYCTDDPEAYPNAAVVIEVLEKLGDILTKAGVDPACFKLSI